MITVHHGYTKIVAENTNVLSGDGKTTVHHYRKYLINTWTMIKSMKWLHHDQSPLQCHFTLNKSKLEKKLFQKH